jgi:hypothetical protein
MISKRKARAQLPSAFNNLCLHCIGKLCSDTHLIPTIRKLWSRELQEEDKTVYVPFYSEEQWTKLTHHTDHSICDRIDQGWQQAMTQLTQLVDKYGEDLKWY